MGVRGNVLRLLDRPGGRKILAAISTRMARRATGLDLDIFHDEVWIHRLGGDYCAESPNFSYTRGWAQAFALRLRESADFWFHFYHPRPGDVILDVGAGIGIDSLVFSRAVGRHGRVLAIEAHPGIFRCLRQQCRWNRLENTTPLNCAIIGRPGLVYIEDRVEHEANTISETPTLSHSIDQIAGTTLDEVCSSEGLDRVDFLKMNIEGAERLALPGMERMIKTTRCVCIACHDFLSHHGDQFRTKDVVVAFLKTAGFAVHLREDDEREYVRYHVHGTRP